MTGSASGSLARVTRRRATPRARARAATRNEWWRRAVFYEVYPRSFKDSSGDGIGDLRGITSKLDYLSALGVDALWITPFFPSPGVDFGYDVSDYENVDPQFGTLADFEQLLEEARAHSMRVVVDLVLNHTSDQHAYFRASRSSRESPYRDWYIWRDGVNGGPPNNWSSVFGPLAWTYDSRTEQYYYHAFYPEQPDLNWRNPAVEEALFGSVRFWLERGVDGFRLDAINWLFEDPALRDNPLRDKLRPGSAAEREQEPKYNRDLPETHDVLRRLRTLTDEYGGDRLLIGEVWAPTIEDLARYYGSHDDELHLPFNFFFFEVPALSAAAFRDEVARAGRTFGGRATTYVLSSHDWPRAYDRYGNGQQDDQIAKLLATMLLTLPGTPFIYYGEEIGMPTTEPRTLEEVHDPVGKRYWPENKGRDGVRTPMQWDGSEQAGFTTGTPWLPVPAGAATRNVQTEAGEPASILNFYKRAIRLRRQSPALLDGTYVALGDDPDVFAYERRSSGQHLVIALNMSAKVGHIDLDMPAAGGTARVVLCSRGEREDTTVSRNLVLAPFEAIVIVLPGGTPPGTNQRDA